jgi:tetratricopeptide (TPR) repeat protein
MKQFILGILMVLCSTALFAQSKKGLLHKGNQLYEQKKYKEAEAYYRKADTDKKQPDLTGKFNMGDAMYKQNKFDDAAQDFTDIASQKNASSQVKAEAYHNLGNSFLSKKDYQNSINAYEKSLLNNPKDDATRYNLAYAQEMLKKQQNKNKNKGGGGGGGGGGGNNQNKQNQNKNNQDKNKQNQQQNQQNQDKQNQQRKDQQQQQQDPNKISKDDAQRMLDALNDREKNTQDKLKNKKLKGGKMHIDKDW